ncbi:MAG TPA: hypothetical protein VL332_06390 [Candidatus Saccharimonadaceae bacterium]|jgi:hypothetical protein|nr:hypothetical protein [Candidatus Saccharimonadaceae bacterium]
MLKRTLQSLLVLCLLTGTSLAATDSFVGDWKLNPSKSTFVDVMKVASLGGNQYAFDFGGGQERIAVDGTDQQALQGTTLAVTVEGADRWKVVRKQEGRMLLTATWKLSRDGKVLRDRYTGFEPNDSASTVNYVYGRTAAGPGFAGTWETTMPINTVVMMQIRPYEGNGLSFTRVPGDTRSLKLDGKDYPVEERGVAQGATSSARRVNEHTLELVDKVNGRVIRTERRELSRDLETLTRTVRPVGQRAPNILVYERQ